MSNRPAPAHQPLFLALGAGVLLWRWLAYRIPSPMVPVPDELRLPLATLGLLFAACGLAAYLIRPVVATRLFCLFGLASGVHWGGAIGSGSRGVELGLLFIYVAISAFGEASFLRLALHYPRPWKFGSLWHAVLYAPALVALLLAPVAGLLPSGVLGPVAGVVLMLATLFGLVAGVVFVVRLVRADAVARRRNGLWIIVAGLFAGAVVAELGTRGVLPGGGEAYNLALALLPVTLLVGLLRGTRDRGVRA